MVKKLNTVLAQPVIGHNVKESMRSLLPLVVDLTGLTMDTAVAAYLLDASTGEYEPQQLREQTGQLSLDIAEPGEAVRDVAEVGVAEAIDAAGMEVRLRRRIEVEDMTILHDDIETPFVRVLAKMEVAGVGIVPRRELHEIADPLKASAATLQGEVQKLAGHEFNVNSPPQLRVVLYDEIGLTPGRRRRPATRPTPRRWSVSATSTRSSRRCFVPGGREAPVDLRRACSPRSQPDGRIHASFNQTVARTGRLSSDAPNLHNIPVRTDGGKHFRSAFVPKPGSVFLVADYNQIELRVIAHFCDDPGLLDAFREGLTSIAQRRRLCSASRPVR